MRGAPRWGRRCLSGSDMNLSLDESLHFQKGFGNELKEEAEMKRNTLLAGTTMCILCLMLSGCVSDKTYRSILAEKEALVLDKDKLSAQNEELNAKIAGLVKEKEVLAGQLATLKLQLKEAQDKGTTAEGNVASLQAQVNEKDGQIKTLNARIQALNAQIEELKKKAAPAPAPEGTPSPSPTPGT